MRIFGGILIALGLLSCLSIVGIIWGLPMILIGVICMVVGGRKTVINNVVTVNAPEQRPQQDWQDRGERNIPTFEPPRQAKLIDATPIRSTRDHAPSPAAQPISSKQYDEAKWEALVQYDTDIARVVAALKPYDPKYIDELAKAYLALNDKQYLPMIVQKILAQAKQDAAAASVVTVHPARKESPASRSA